MDRTRPVGEGFAQDHVATAFPIDQSVSRRGVAQTGLEVPRGSQFLPMQLWIATWQIYRITIHLRILIRQRRKGSDLGALGAPVGEQVGVDEAEGMVHSDRDT